MEQPPTSYDLLEEEQSRKETKQTEPYECVGSKPLDDRASITETASAYCTPEVFSPSKEDISASPEEPMSLKEESLSSLPSSATNKLKRGERDQGFMSEAQAPDSYIDVLRKSTATRCRDPEAEFMTEEEARREDVEQYLPASALDLSIRSMNSARWRWLYHWLGFSKEEKAVADVLQKSGYADKTPLTYEVLRPSWANLLLKLWNHPSFYAFRDADQAIKILKKDSIKVKEKMALKKGKALIVVVRLSSTWPGAITLSKMVKDGVIHTRYYCGPNGALYCGEKFEIEDLVAKAGSATEEEDEPIVIVSQYTCST